MVRQILIGILTFETLLYRYLRWPDGNDGDGGNISQFGFKSALYI